MMKGIFTLLFCLGAHIALAQIPSSPGTVDGQYVSFQSGDWNATTTWSRWDGTAMNWVQPSPTTPTNADNTIVIASPHVVTVTAGVIVDQVTVNSGSRLVINGPSSAITFQVNRTAAAPASDLLVNGTVDIQNGTLKITTLPSALVRVGSGGSIINTSGAITGNNAARLMFDGGSLFQLKNFQSSVPTATWNVASTCLISANVNGAVLNLSQAFGNFTWDTPILDDFQELDGALINVQGNLSFVNTGGQAIYLSYSSPYVLNVGGNATFSSSSRVVLTGDANSTVNVTGALTSQATLLRGSDDIGIATINVTGATSLTGGTFDAGSSTGSTVLNLAGNYTNSGASIIRSGSPASGMAVNFTGAGIQNYTSTNVPAFPVNYVTNGTSNLRVAATSFLAGPGSLTIGATSRITLLSTLATGALQANTTGGNVRVSGTRIYNGSIVYGASARQYMATTHPGTANTIIANTGGVTMLGSVAFTTGALSLNSGLLRIENSSTLTVATVANSGG
ncbi:MAG: hypothetical protein ABJA70_18250, partial [Chryseolinea sp.]